MIHLLAYQYGTVSDIEIVWILLAFIGAIFSLLTLREALADKEFLESIKATSGGRYVLAKAAIINEGARFLIQLIFLILGLMIATIPDPPPELHQPLKIVIISAFLRWGLITASLLLTYKSYVNHRVRVYFREHPNDEPQRRGSPLPEPGDKIDLG